MDSMCSWQSDGFLKVIVEPSRLKNVFLTYSGVYIGLFSGFWVPVDLQDWTIFIHTHLPNIKDIYLYHKSFTCTFKQCITYTILILLCKDFEPQAQ